MNDSRGFRFSPRPNQADRIDWREWGEEPFAQAEREEKMVLLSISAVWCHWCHVMDETTYSDPEVIELINENFIPIRVDNDRRPEINRRYNQGGWPTTAFLEPRGNILAGSTYIPPQNMREILRRFIGLWRDKREDIARNVEEALDGSGPEPAGPADIHPRIMEDVWRAAVREFDHQYGGLGKAPKFPMFEVLELAMDIYLDRKTPAALAWLVLTLDNMLSGGTYDHVEGGLFRYSTTRDWSVPHFEKMLSDNARMALLLLRAWRLTGNPVYPKSAADILDYVEKALGDGKGGFYGSQDADEEYYSRDLRGRRELEPPFVDPTVYVDSQAVAVEAFLEAGEALGDPRYARLGRDGLRLLAGLVSSDRGVPHYREGSVYMQEGLLEDQVSVLLALERGHQLTGEPDLLDKAALLGEIILKHYWDGERRLLTDVDARTRTANLDPQPAEINTASLAATGLLTLAGLTDNPDLEEPARGILEAYAAAYPLYSFHAAPYARAVDLLLSRPRVVTLLGDEGDDGYGELRRAALLSPLPRLLLRPMGNNHEAGGRASKPGEPGEARASLCEGTSCELATADAGELGSALSVNESLRKEGR